MIATLPMYGWPELGPANDALWDHVKRELSTIGEAVPNTLAINEDETHGWLDADLVFSQTCGYPFATKLVGKVSLLGTPHYAVDGCRGAQYSSAIIVRQDSDLTALENLTPAKFAYNSSNSLSGYRCLSPLVGDVEQAFPNSIRSGGHRNSASMVAKGEADFAAIDAVCWHYFRQFETEHASRLRVLQWTPLLPSLPFITRRVEGRGQIAALRGALEAAISKASHDPIVAPLAIAGCSFVAEDEYSALAAL